LRETVSSDKRLIILILFDIPKNAHKFHIVFFLTFKVEFIIIKSNNVELCYIIALIINHTTYQKH